MSLQATMMQHVMNNYGQRALTIVRGEGAYLYDDEERQYLDFMAGIAVCNLGHAHPEITSTIVAQAGQLLHCSNLFQIPKQAELARKLADLSGLDRVFFCNSGTEANEAAMKLVRKYADERGELDRTQIVSLPGGFHGRTLGALSITAKPAYQDGFKPLVPECVTPSELDEVVHCINRKTAACFVEVVQGEGGVRPIPTQILEDIAQRCREVGALLVVDEVQTGVGRTGTFFAFEQAGITPDVVTMAKGLANGIPIGAVLAREEVAAAFTPGTHGSTFGGNPFATAVASTVVDCVSLPEFLQHVSETGQYLHEKLCALGDNVTGIGFMWGMTVPDSKQYVARAAECGVLLTSVGERRVRFVPPLIVTAHQIDEMYSRLKGIRM